MDYQKRISFGLCFLFIYYSFFDSYQINLPKNMLDLDFNSVDFFSYLSIQEHAFHFGIDPLYFSPRSSANCSPSSLFLSFAISFWLIAELLFFARWKYLENHINANKSMYDVQPTITNERRDHLLKMAAKYATLIDGGMKEWVSSWFYGCDFNDISYENAVEYINWAFFINTNVNDQFSRFAINCIEDYTNHKFENGHNPNVRYVHNTSDQRPIFSTYRPFVFYFALLIGQCIADFVFLYILEFKYEMMNGLKVWYKIQSADAAHQSQPICLIHGLGMHYLPYIPLIYKLYKKSSRHDVVCIEVPWIAMSLWHFVPESVYKLFGVDTSHSYIDSKIPAKTKDFVQILQNMEGKIVEKKKKGKEVKLQLEWTLIGHSYGSFLVSGIYQFVKQQNDGLHLPRLVLLDPVTLCLTDPTTVSFLVTEAKDWMTWILQHVAARELMVSCTLSKYFHWFEYNMYPEDLMNGQVEHIVVTADCDALIPHELIGKGIRGVNEREEKDVKKIHHISFNNLYHAMWLGSPTCIQRIVDAI